MKQYVDIKTASGIFGLSVVTLRRAVKSGRIPAIRLDGTPRGTLLFDVEAVAQVLADEAYRIINQKFDS